MSYYELSKKYHQIALNNGTQLKVNRIIQAFSLKKQILLVCQNQVETILLMIDVQNGLSQKYTINRVELKQLDQLRDCIQFLTVTNQLESQIFLLIKTESNIYQARIVKIAQTNLFLLKIDQIVLKQLSQHMNTVFHTTQLDILYLHRQNYTQIKVIKLRKTQKNIQADQPIILPISHKYHLSVIAYQIFYYLPHLQKHASFTINTIDLRLKNPEKEVYTLACIRNNICINTIKRVAKDTKIVIFANYMDCKKYLVWVYDLKMGYSTNLLQYDSVVIKVLSLADEGSFQILEETEQHRNQFETKISRRNKVRRFNVYESEQIYQQQIVSNLDQILVSDSCAIFGINYCNQSLIVYEKVSKKQIYRQMLKRSSEKQVQYTKTEGGINLVSIHPDLIDCILDLL